MVKKKIKQKKGNQDKDKMKNKHKKESKIQKELKENLEINNEDSTENIKEKIKKIKYLIVSVGNEECFDGVEAFKENGEKVNEKDSPLHYYDFNFEVDVDNGKISNWSEEKIYVKVNMRAMDTGFYTFFDENKIKIYEEEGYVPNFLGIEGDAYGDNIIFSTDVNGFILNWKEKKIKEQIIKYLNDKMKN